MLIEQPEKIARRLLERAGFKIDWIAGKRELNIQEFGKSVKLRSRNNSAKGI